MKKPIRDFDKIHKIFHVTNRDGGINSTPTDGLPLDIDLLGQPSNFVDRVSDDLGQPLDIELGGENKPELHRDSSLEILDTTPPQRLPDAQSPWTYYDPEDTVKKAEAKETVDYGSNANGGGPTRFNSPFFSRKIPMSWECVNPSSKNTDEFDMDNISIAATEPVSESESGIHSPETCVKCTQESHHRNSFFSDMFANNTCGNATRPPLRRLQGFYFN